jgi:DNA-binding transcriptional MerR regulator
MLPRMTDKRTLLRKLENVDAFPLIALQALPELRADLDAVEAEALLRARELGASLEDIAEALAITRQGVAYKLKVLAGNGDDHEDADEAEVVEVAEGADVAEVGEFVEVPDEAEVADEAEDEVVDITEPETQAQEPEAEPEPQPETRWPSLEDLRPDPEARRSDIDPRVPHTKA